VKEYVLNNNPELKGMYLVTDDNTEVLYLSDVTSTIASFTETPQVFNF